MLKFMIHDPEDYFEKDVEKRLVDQVAQLGGKAYKFSSPANRAVPDRLVCFPQGRIIFVELKAPGKTATPLQAKIHKFLRGLGHEVLVVDTKKKVDTLITVWEEELNDPNYYRPTCYFDEYYCNRWKEELNDIK